jgi:hypothetical protein
MTDAIILHASLRRPASPHADQKLLQALPYAKRLELASRSSEGRRTSLAALGLTLMAAERIGRRSHSPGAFSFPAEGKPVLRDGPRFSVSHTASYVACIVCAVSECGIDIEETGAYPDAATVLKLERWTATEAALKAAGQGLRAAREVVLGDSLDFAVLRDQQFVLQALDAVPGCIGHVASSAGLQFVVEEVDLAGPGISAVLQRSLGLPSQFEQEL